MKNIIAEIKAQRSVEHNVKEISQKIENKDVKWKENKKTRESVQVTLIQIIGIPDKRGQRGEIIQKYVKKILIKG